MRAAVVLVGAALLAAVADAAVVVTPGFVEYYESLVPLPPEIADVIGTDDPLLGPDLSSEVASYEVPPTLASALIEPPPVVKQFAESLYLPGGDENGLQLQLTELEGAFKGPYKKDVAFSISPQLRLVPRLTFGLVRSIREAVEFAINPRRQLKTNDLRFFVQARVELFLNFNFKDPTAADLIAIERFGIQPSGPRTGGNRRRLLQEMNETATFDDDGEDLVGRVKMLPVVGNARNATVEAPQFVAFAERFFGNTAARWVRQHADTQRALPPGFVPPVERCLFLVGDALRDCLQSVAVAEITEALTPLALELSASTSAALEFEAKFGVNIEEAFNGKPLDYRFFAKFGAKPSATASLRARLVDADLISEIIAIATEGKIDLLGNVKDQVEEDVLEGKDELVDGAVEHLEDIGEASTSHDQSNMTSLEPANATSPADHGLGDEEADGDDDIAPPDSFVDVAMGWEDWREIFDVERLVRQYRDFFLSIKNTLAQRGVEANPLSKAIFDSRIITALLEGPYSQSVVLRVEPELRLVLGQSKIPIPRSFNESLQWLADPANPLQKSALSFQAQARIAFLFRVTLRPIAELPPTEQLDFAALLDAIKDRADRFGEVYGLADRLPRRLLGLDMDDERPPKRRAREARRPSRQDHLGDDTDLPDLFSGESGAQLAPSELFEAFGNFSTGIAALRARSLARRGLAEADARAVAGAAYGPPGFGSGAEATLGTEEALRRVFVDLKSEVFTSVTAEFDAGVTFSQPILSVSAAPGTVPDVVPVEFDPVSASAFAQFKVTFLAGADAFLKPVVVEEDDIAP